MPRSLFACLVALLVACAADPTLAPRDCTPGQSVVCACPGGTGAQACGADGTLGACVCSDAGAAPDVPAVDTPAPPDRVTPDVVDAAPTVDAVEPGDVVDVVTDSPAVDVVDAPAAPDVVVCEPRQTCGADCVADYQTDPRHCGSCFNRCTPRGTNAVPTCSGGRCVLGCSAGFVPCGTGACVNPAASTFDCAACGFSCLSGQRCDYDGRRGRCVPL